MNLEQFKWVLEKGIDCNMIVLLIHVSESSVLPDNIKVKGWKILLEKHGLIANNNLTEKGEIYLSEFKNLEKTKLRSGFQLTVWIESLHETITNKVKKLTGKTQVYGNIKGRSYAFIPNVRDFTVVLKNCIKVYNIVDYIKVENTIISFIEKCHKENKWYPLLQNYIMKDGQSKLATDLLVEYKEEPKEKNELVDTNELF